MSKQIQGNSSSIGDHKISSLAHQIQSALTQHEISQLLNVLFTVLSDDLWDTVLTQLAPNTQETIKQILAPSPIVEQVKKVKSLPTSQAKLAETWLNLWQEWDKIIDEAAQEKGEYITQEEDWEMPYFDAVLLSENLEKVAQKMQPLIQVAVENRFNPNAGFASALLDAESEISTSIPDWMDIDNGIELLECATACLLQWEWLTVKLEGQDAFDFAQRIRQLSEAFEYVYPDNNEIGDFLLELSYEEQQSIFAGLNSNRESDLWKETLTSIYSPWHQFYLEALHQFASPDIYLETLRATIPQQWQNGLPIIEDLLVKQNYSLCLTVIAETLNSLLKLRQQDKSWQPETSLLFPLVNRFYSSNGQQDNEKNLLRFYQQTSQELGELERVKALEIQLITFDSCFDWSTMFKTFAEVGVSETTRASLFQSWRDYVILRAKPRLHFGSSDMVTKSDIWWLHWLIDSIATSDLGIVWFQAQIQQWLINLPGDKRNLGDAYDILRLLTKDLTEIQYKNQPPYPKFYQFVIQARGLSVSDDPSRLVYLQQYAPDHLWEQVMAYWQKNLHNFVPKPELCKNSDYTEHSQWMFALQELAPQSYHTLLAQWRVQHQRRSNLWKALGVSKS
ncbi:MAG: hypothetical protein WCO29_08890 [Nostocales cyanobacterium ELA583]|jgi:HPt (histidine-containing phosphotransfer) domain-containing protein